MNPQKLTPSYTPEIILVKRKPWNVRSITTEPGTQAHRHSSATTGHRRYAASYALDQGEP